MSTPRTRHGSKWGIDLLGVIGYALLAIVAVSVGDPSGVTIALLVIPLLLFLPGYAVTAVFFPRSSTGANPDRSIDRIERVGLAIGLSVALLPLIGIVIGATHWEITRQTTIVGAGTLTIMVGILALMRRHWVDPDERYHLVPERSVGENQAYLGVRLTLAACVIIAVGVFGFALAMPQDESGTTDLYLLEPGDNGEFIDEDYPATVGLDESLEIDVVVDNQEYTRNNYTLVVQLERVENGEDPDVEEAEILSGEQFVLDHDESWQDTLEFSPTMTGEPLRVSFLLYEGDPHVYTDQVTAYRHVHIWIDVPED